MSDDINISGSSNGNSLLMKISLLYSTTRGQNNHYNLL